MGGKARGFVLVGERDCVEPFRQTEVGNHHLTIFSQDDIIRREPFVLNPLLMGVIQGIRQLCDNGQDGFRMADLLLIGQPISQPFAGNIPAGNIILPIDLTGIHDRHNILVL